MDFEGFEFAQLDIDIDLQMRDLDSVLGLELAVELELGVELALGLQLSTHTPTIHSHSLTPSI
jgi:hypothetical protein